MSRQEDFKQKATEYNNNVNMHLDFYNGAEYGYQYAVEKVLAKVQELYPQAAAYYEQPEVFIEQIRKAMQ